VFGLSSQNRFLFGLLPITEGKSLRSALLPRINISNITEKLLYKSGAFLVMILQKSVSGHWFGGEKTKFLWPIATSEHKDRRLENAILFLDGSISEKMVHESATFLL